MLISHWLKSLRSRLHRPVRASVSKKRRNQRVAPKQVTTAVEFLEERVLLAGAGPQLISIFPNAGITQPEDTGGRLQENEVLETAPRELIFRFNPGQQIDPASLGGIQVFRSGFDGDFNNGSVPVDVGSVQIGDQPNEVILRFEDSLPDDHYQIVIKGTGNNPLQNTMQMPFNNGQDQSFLFEIDLGGQIEAVVHEPIVRTQLLTVTDTAALTDGSRFTVKAGGKPITFEFDDNGVSNADGENVFAIDTSLAATPSDYALAIRLAFQDANAVHGNAFGLEAFQTAATLEISANAETAFSPSITPDADVAEGVTISDGEIQQREDFVNVYFNANDPLSTGSPDNPTTVESPAFYRLIYTDGTVRLPNSVFYNADAGVATLRFNNPAGTQPLKPGTYNLRIGETNEATNTLATTVNLGTRFGDATTTINDFIGGDPTTNVLDPNDIDLYRFQILTPGKIVLSLTATNDLDAHIRVFDENGNVVMDDLSGLAVRNVDSDDPTIIFSTDTLAPGYYVIGISSQGNESYDPTTGANAMGGGSKGSYRLTITQQGVNDVPSNDDNSSFDNATNLGNLGTAGQVVTAQIQPQNNPLFNLQLPPEPGGTDEPGHKDIPLNGENHIGSRGNDPSFPGGIPRIAFTFDLANPYGSDPQGNALFNAITIEQQQRARDIFEMYSLMTGLQFVETESRAEAAGRGLGVFTIVTGDLRALDPGVPTGPGGVGGIAGGGLAIIDAGENFTSDDNLYGASWFRIATHEIGHLLGLGHSYDIPSIQGGSFTSEPVFPGDNDIVHIRRLHPRDSIDIDLYQFDLTEAGQVTIEAIAERLTVPDQASQLNTVLQLYRQDMVNGVPVRTLIAQNDDYYGNDSFMSLQLEEGTYFIGVTSVGNEDYDPRVSNSGANGRTDGEYELRLDIRPNLEPLTEDPADPADVSAQGRSTIRDVDNSDQFDGGPRTPTAFDGDGDGHAGGQFSYSFQVGDTIFVDKAAANSTDPNYPDAGAALGSISNPYTEIDLALMAARNQRDANISANDPTPVIVRIVGNSGGDGQLGTLLDNTAYEVGINNDPVFPGNLVDGATLEVPRDVNVVIDGGAVFKLQGANLDAGSSAQGIDRSGGSLQILGTAFNDVVFTSWHDDSIGGDSDGVHPGASSGDWGGLVFRQDSDYDFEYRDTQTQINIYPANNPFEYTFSGFPVPARDATLSFLAFGDFSASNEFLTVHFIDAGGNLISGAPVYHLFDNTSEIGLDETTISTSRQLTTDELALIAAATDGKIRIQVTASSAVDDLDGVESLRVDLSAGTDVPLFLNTVNHATIQYGGGSVNVDSIVQNFDSIHLDSARPTLTHNTITLGAASAISADPNSFNDTFEDPRRFDHHLDRLGPDIHGNDVFNNELNGVRIRTELVNGVPLNKLNVPARFTSTDIVYIISENFQIEGSPGGLTVDPGDDPDITSDDAIVKRSPGRLRIDPGVVVKLTGSRIEMERGGSNLIAEGTPEDPIIFTSINDDSYGRGGDFDTANDGAPFQDFGMATLNVAWTAQGPAPATDGQVENVVPDNQVVGAAHVIAAHPTNPDVMFLGGTNGGIWRTENATSLVPTWVPLTDQFPSLSIGALEFDPTDSTAQTLVAGIGRYSSFARVGGDRIGLLRTTDGGDTWTVINGGGTLDGKNISGVAARGNVIVVSVNTADNFTLGNVGIFRSTDGGDTFTQISVGDGTTNGLPAGVSYDLAGDPTNPNILYTSVAFSDLAGGQVGIYKSLNAGLTWTKVSDAAIDAFIDNGTTNLTGTSNLEISVGTNNNVYAGIINAGALAALFRSGDGGATWVQMDTPSTNEGGTNIGLNPGGGDGPPAGSTPQQLASGQGAIHFSILADPTDENLVYVGGDRQPLSNGDMGSFPNSIGATDFTGRLFRGDASQPLGSQFVHLTHSNSMGPVGGGTASSSAPHADSRELVFDALGNLVESDDGGIYRRTSPQDNTGDWFSIIGNLQITEVHDIAYDSVSDIIITGNQDTGTTQQTSPGSSVWESVSTADGGDVAVDDTSTPGSSFRYSSFQDLGAFRRREYDANNVLISETFIDTSMITDPQFTTPVVLNAVNAQRMIIGGANNVYESMNQGDTISPIGTIGVNSGSTIAYGGFIGTTPNPDVLWVGSGNQLFLRTTPSGALTATSYSGGTVTGVVLDPTDWRIAYVTDSDQIFMTNDGGQTFTEITGAAPFDTNLRSITYLKGTTTDALLVGGQDGVYGMDIRTPGTWFNVGQNLPNAPVFDMEYDAADDVLVVGTLGRGAFAITNAQALIEAELLANEPEPIGVTPVPGDWAGLVFNAASTGNLDYVEVYYGGGTAPIAGRDASFNAVEIIQADVRIANSEFKDNANGRIPGAIAGNRLGRGANVDATIFVRGAQPVIVTNVFENNRGDVISIDANAMKAIVNDDPGRATDLIYSRPFFGTDDPNAQLGYANNFGPLVRNNRMTGNQFNGMEVRGGELTTETLWDDIDIVHIVRSEISVPNLHTFGGLRLQSSSRESLVVKLDGQNAGFTASGSDAEIIDRVGGTLEIVGMPGRPVILTSLYDNSVGAGFAPDGTPLLQTVDSTARSASPGDWRSVLLDEFSNDRNVAVYNERERHTGFDSDANKLPNVQPNGPEALGRLAADQASADDNDRAGFEVHGFINTDVSADEDVYSFIAEAGTEVWFDIDNTAGSLDSILELVSADGTTVLASSDDSQQEQFGSELIQSASGVIAVNMRKDERDGGDFYTTNPKDAGMRVILPGNAGTSNTYFIRVRSKDALTSGEYQLQIRLQQRDEHAGSTVSFSQIRYATNGIEIIGQPGHSPLVGEGGENDLTGSNNTQGGADSLGNMLSEDRNTYGVAGNLSSANDVDFYQFDVTYQGIQSIPGVNDPTSGDVAYGWSTIFDVDYADGLARANTSLYIFDSSGQLILTGTDSNIADDQPEPLGGTDVTDPSRGSVGKLDPYIGSIELPEGSYFAVVTANANLPSVLTQYLNQNVTNAISFTRLEPVDSVNRLVEDHIGSQGGMTFQDPGTLTPLIDANDPTISLTSSIVPWHLGDVTLFVSQGTGNSSSFYTVDPLTGALETRLVNSTTGVRDIAIRRQNDRLGNNDFTGDLVGFRYSTNGNDNSDFITFDSGDGSTISTQDDGITTFTFDSNGNIVADNQGINFNALTYSDGTAGSSGIENGNNTMIYAVGTQFGDLAAGTLPNVLYRFNLNGTGTSAPGGNRTGNARVTPAYTDIVERGILDTTVGGAGNDILIAPTGAEIQAVGTGDDSTFRINLNGGGTVDFEMDSGPALQFDVAVGQNQFIVDGDTITIDGTVYEYDTGAVLIVDALNQGQLNDGDTFTILDPTFTPRIFEIDTDGNFVTGTGRIRVNLTVAPNQGIITNIIASTINSAGIGVTAQPLATNRISLIGDQGVNTSSVNGVSDFGVAGVTPGNTAIGAAAGTVEETSTGDQLATATANVVNAADMGRGALNNLVNFPRNISLDAITLNNAVTGRTGIIVDLGTSGGTSNPGTLNEVDYFFSDTAMQVATEIALQINNEGQATATSAGQNVQLTSPGDIFETDPAFTSQPPFQITGGAPGGLITGLATLGGTLYAITDTGGLFTVNGVLGRNATLSYVSTATDLVDINFQGLTAGPPNVEGGAYSNMLFGISATGDIYGFTTGGALQPVFGDGVFSVSTGLNGTTGLAFSNLDENLWHMTDDRDTDSGHGINPLFNDSVHSTIPGFTRADEGDDSLYFGNEVNNNEAENTYGGLAGGAHGTIETNAFSLDGYSADDLPTVYFNYFLESQSRDVLLNEVPPMLDSFRVSVWDSNTGQWDLVTTNNSDRSTVLTDEYDYQLPSGVAEDRYIQEAFNFDENLGQWRQVRIDLSPYAGLSDLRLRFDFSSDGSMNLGDTFTTGTELRAKDGSRLQDGQRFTIDGTTFEFDLGFTINVPSGGHFSDGDTVSVTGPTGVQQVFEFNNGGGVTPGNTAVPFLSTDTADTLAARLLNAINGAGIPGVIAYRNGDRVNVNANGAGAPFNVTLSSSTAGLVLDPFDNAGATGGTVPLIVNADMDSYQVAAVMRQAIADTFNGGLLSTVKTYKDVVRIIEHDVTGQSRVRAGGALEVANSLQGDEFGRFYIDNGLSAAASQTTSRELASYNFEGLYIDDIIIGFAERGEIATGAPGGTSNFVANAASFPDDIDVGRYQLEVRRGTEYSIAHGGFPIGTSDSNDHLTNKLTIDIRDGSQIFDGQRFQLSDGARTATFEFADLDLVVGDPNFGIAQGTPDLPNFAVGFRATESAATIAARLRTLLNSTAVRNHLNITSALANGSVTGNPGSSSEVNVFGTVAANTSGDVTNGAFNISGFLNFESFANLGAEFPYLGDQNLDRQQGSVQIAQNFIFDTLNVGIRVDDDVRQAGNEPAIGVPRSLPVNNNDRLTRGVRLTNNVIGNFGSAGIELNGDNNNGAGPLAAVPFHRVINNTIYGGATPTGDGIRISNNVDPTLLNNIIANTNVSINNTTGSNDIVVARSTYQNNNSNPIPGVNPQNLFSTEPLFVDPATNNFYLAAGARPIDSARNQFEDRDSIVQVSESIGIPRSNLFAPLFDAYGQFRTNDQNTPNTGEGNPPYFDRGAVEREDIFGPSARLIEPEDLLTGAGPDLDPDATEVYLENAVIRRFIVGLNDVGIGIDDTSVNTSNVQLTFNGQVLTAGVDYLFRYNANTKQITLEAASGVFPIGDYQIRLLNTNGIRDLAGNNLLANRQPAGTTAFDITIAPPPVITIQDVTITEGDSGSKFAEFLVALSGPPSQDVTVNVQTSDGTATSAAGPNQDYIAEPLQQIVFDNNPMNDPDGDPDNNPLTQLFRVEIIGDFRVEGDETFFVNLSDPVNASIASGSTQAVGTINDDDLLLRLEPSSQTQDEGDLGTTDMNFTVTLIDKGTQQPVLTPRSFDVTVDYSTMDNTALAGQDYEAAIGTVTIDGSSNSATFAVPIIGDELQEDPPLEDFMVMLSNPVNAGIDVAFDTAIGEIQDDDPKFRVEGAPVVVEGENGTTPIRRVTFTVSISSPVVSPVSVDYMTEDGTATGGLVGDPNIDYLSTSGTLTFIPGGGLTQTVVVTIVGDSIAEGDEAFDLVLSNPTAGGIAVAAGTATILEDEPLISIDDVSMEEGNLGTTNASFTVSLSEASPDDVTVDYATSLGNTVPGPLPGQIYETNPNSTFSTPQVLDPRGFGRVVNPNINDTQGTNVSSTIDHITILGRGNDAFDYFAFDGLAGQRLILDVDGATFNSRLFVYNAAGTVVFSNDDGFVNGGPNGDGTDVGSNSTEDAFLETVLTNSGRYTIAVGRSDSNPLSTGLTGTPLQNGDQYTLHVSLSNYAAPAGTIFEENLSTGQESVPNDSLAAPRSLEGEFFNTTFNMNVNDQTGANNSISVPHVTIQGTGDGTADYYSFNVTTAGSFGYFDIDGASFDTVLDVFNSNGTNIATNDDGPVFDTGSSSGLDSLMRAFFPAAGTYIVRVTDLGNFDDTLDPGATYQLNVAIENHALGAPPNVSGPTPIDGTAIPGSDFTTTTGSVTIPGGMGLTTATITIPITADQMNEPDETYFVRLANAMGGVIQDGTGIGTIVNDDAPVIMISDGIPIPPNNNTTPGPVRETGAQGLPNTVRFTVTLTRPADVPTTIDYTTVSGNAIAGMDFVPVSGQLMFNVGEQTKQINVQLIKDGVLNEPNESFFVNLSNPQGADFGDNQGMATIIDSTGLVERVLAVVAPDAGQPGIVKVLDANGGERFSFEPYPGFQGGVRVATGDINKDGTPDIITVPGPGGGPHVKAFSGVDGSELLSFMAFDPSFTGGLFVATGDFAQGVDGDGDGFQDIIVGADAGGGARVSVFSSATGGINNRTFNPNNIGTDPNRLLFNFFPFDAFSGGVRVAAGDVTGDGVDDLVTAAGAGGGPHVKVYNGRFTGPSNPPSTARDGRSFFAYAPTFTGGIYLAVGDVDTRPGSEAAEIITGAGANGGPHVRIFNVRNLGTNFAMTPTPVSQFFAYATNFTGGVRVGAGFANDADTNQDILTTPGPGGGAHLRAFSGASLTPMSAQETAARVPVYPGTSGMFVAGVQDVNVQFVGAPLRAAETGTATATTPLTQQDVDAVREAALDRLREAGVSEADIARLSDVSITVDDLSGDLVGLATTGGIILDVNAAGNGWFIDPTPDRDEEFAGTGNELTAIDLSAARRTDLLTVILHELGHKLGLDDLHSQLHPDALMTATLPAGTRRLPSSEEMDEAFTDESLFDSLLLN